MSLNFDQDIILENEVVKLTPLVKSDFEHLLPFSLNEPELWTYSLVAGNGEENLIRYIDLALSGRINQNAYAFLVYDKRTNEYAGTSRFYDIQNGHKTTQLGYTWFGNKFQGTGLNKNCKYLMLQFAFEQMKVERVEFRADNNNKISIAAMKSLGCIEEGVLRSNCDSPTGRRDSIVLSILKSEWINNVKESLIEKISHKKST